MDTHVTPIPVFTRMVAGWLVSAISAALSRWFNGSGSVFRPLVREVVVREVAASLRLWTGWRFISLLAGLMVSCFPWVGAYGLTLELNYAYDTNGFFDVQTVEGAKARKALEFAVQAFEPFTDQLSAIQPEGINQWTALFTAPDTGESVQLINPEVSADTLLVFVGGRDLAGAEVGRGGPGGRSASGTAGFTDIVFNRGQGITRNTDGFAVDYGPWGGAVSFDTTNANGTSRNWNFDVDSEPSFGQADLLSVAVHELGHMLGFGTSASYDNQITGSQFQGNAVLTLNSGQSVQVTSDRWHWDGATPSPPFASPQPNAAMGSTLTLGSRTVFTPLDYAALKDIGWEVPDILLGLPGDLNSDPDVDGEDFLRWQRGFGMTSGASVDSGDADGDGDVDDYDGWIVRRNLGAKTATQTTLVQVPEPTSMGLCLPLGCLFVFSRCWTKKGPPSKQPR